MTGDGTETSPAAQWRVLAIVLRVPAVSLLAVSALHLALGLRADVLLGIALPASVIASPGLFSQNRFFGVAYGLYAAVLWLAAGDLQRSRPVLCAALWLTLLAGLVLLALLQFGVPPVPVLPLSATELLIPPLLLAWLGRGGSRQA